MKRKKGKRFWEKERRTKKIFATIIAITTMVTTTFTFFAMMLSVQSAPHDNSGYVAPPVKGVPVLTPIGMIALIVPLAIFAIIVIKKKQK